MMLWFKDKVVSFMGVFLKIIQLIDVPQSVVANIFVSFAADGVKCWSMWIITFPKVLIQDVVSPRNVFSLSNFVETAPVHILRCTESTSFEQSRAYIDVGNDFFND